MSDIETHISDQGQGGAQSIEDGAALGILFSRLPPPSTADDLDKTIAERLQGLESVRRDRASLMQIYSNAGQDEPEKIREEAMKFLKEGAKVPGKSLPVCPRRTADVKTGHFFSESRRVPSVQFWVRCGERQRRGFEWPTLDVTGPTASINVSVNETQEEEEKKTFEREKW